MLTDTTHRPNAELWACFAELLAFFRWQLTKPRICWTRTHTLIAGNPKVFFFLESGGREIILTPYLVGVFFTRGPPLQTGTWQTGDRYGRGSVPAINLWTRVHVYAQQRNTFILHTCIKLRIHVFNVFRHIQLPHAYTTHTQSHTHVGDKLFWRQSFNHWECVYVYVCAWKREGKIVRKREGARERESVSAGTRACAWMHVMHSCCTCICVCCWETERVYVRDVCV